MQRHDIAADVAVQEKSAAAQPAPASRRAEADLRRPDAARSKAQPLGRDGALARFGTAPDKSRGRGDGGGGKIAYSFKKIAKAAIDGPFVPLSLELLVSDAWRSLSINARRVLDLLLAEHLRHGGRENGHLRLPWRSMEAGGIARRYIAAALVELEEHGLIVASRGAYGGGGRSAPSTYTITFLPMRFVGATGGTVYTSPLNYWQRYKKPAAAAPRTGSRKSF